MAARTIQRFLASMPANRRGMGRALIALGLTAAFAFAFSQEAKPPPKSLVLFPFGLGDNAFSPEGYKLGEGLSSAFEKKIKTDERYRVTFFTRSHPSIRRAINEGTLPTSILIEPFTGKFGQDIKAVRLANYLRSDFAVAGLIEAFRFSGDTKSATLTVIIELYDVKENKSVGVVVTTVTGSGETGAEAAKSAVEALVEKTLPQIAEQFFKPVSDRDGRGGVK